jgi:hypothetical protein
VTHVGMARADRMVTTMSPKLHSRARTGRGAVASCAAVIAWMMVIGLSPARADGVFAGDCLRGGSYSCFGYWRDRVGNPHLIRVPPPSSEEDAAEAAERERRWVARCRPIIRQDRYGVGRYQYAAPGCEYGKYE